MPHRLLAGLFALLLFAAPPALSHSVGQEGEAGEPEEAAELIDIKELVEKMAGERGDIREQQGEPETEFPENAISLSPVVQRVIDDEINTDEQRRQLRLFHGQWDKIDSDKLTVDQRARLALFRYKLQDPSLSDEQTDPHLRAEAALLRGEPEQTIKLLTETKTIRAAVQRGLAFEDLGKLPEAVAQYEAVKTFIDKEGQISRDAETVTAAARAVANLARLEGRPAREYHAVMGWLGRIYAEIDPFYWPARVTEAQLLVEKSNLPEAGNTLMETLAVNPRSSEAWFGMGLLSVQTYNFARAANAVEKLRAINEDHVLADVVEIRSYLRQKDVASARKVIEAALLRYPTHRELSALLAATEAMAYDEEATARALKDHDELAGKSPYAYFTVGETLASARQYDWSIALLKESIARAPAWAEPRLELGLVLMQKGDLERALEELDKARKIDPFNTRVNNQLKLVREMVDEYPTIETETFVIRFAAGPDEVLARDISRHAERMHAEFTAYFGHTPANKTQIDIMPDQEHFAVRITGLPDIWTIAACTGDVMALTPPKVGTKQRGLFDWHNVVGHEYVHTVTLAQTSNRILHWFTEACAVHKETTGRTWRQYQLLAWAYHNDSLFELDEINWGFIRPKTPRDRPLAYAQAAWMLEYLIETHGQQSMVDLLNLYATGISNTDGIAKVTSDAAEVFYSGFKQWAGEQVNEWGLDQESRPSAKDAKLIRAAYQAKDADKRAEALAKLEKKKDRRELQKLAARHAISHASTAEAIAAVQRFKRACPVDPWSYEQLLQLSLRNDDPEQAGDVDAALEALVYLDRTSGYSPDYAAQLVEIYRAQGDLENARAAIQRALFRSPYDGSFRETAATLALQARDLPDALFHLESLALLEPERALHQVRLAALYHKIGDKEKSAEAAMKAREIDPASKVDRYLPQAVSPE